MLSEFQVILSDWGSLDTWIVLTAAVVAMACALPGNFLVLRKQSMMGDALSHTVLPGIVAAFLFAHWLKTSAWISSETYDVFLHTAMFSGAMLLGVLSALLTEWVQKLGRVESSAALGVVFTTLFAIGLLAIRVAADNVHIDPDCVLYGTIETVVMDKIPQVQLPQSIHNGLQNVGLMHVRMPASQTELNWDRSLPRAALVNGAALAANLVLLVLFFKELRISTFDPSLATSLGINARFVHYALMAATAATLVAAFESVGSILVIAMLIIPSATAHLLTDRLSVMVALSLLVAVLSAILGHVLALTLPAVLLARIGFDTLHDVSASTAGMMAVAAGCLFGTAALLGPRHGLISKTISRFLLSLRISGEDFLGLLYRLEEVTSAGPQQASSEIPRLNRLMGISPLLSKIAVHRLRWDGKIVATSAGYRLTDIGRAAAKKLVRSHRMWESYMAKYFPLPGDHLHATASRVEHFLDPELLRNLESELDKPERDPHGREIPTESNGVD